MKNFSIPVPTGPVGGKGSPGSQGPRGASGIKFPTGQTGTAEIEGFDQIFLRS